ncbi:zinc finger matrin-type protein 5 [Epargyreus clarus]|uniref:zinc finger matrin-type protein 5 n=1 Tax=Epargyreus clarus TaxID=520877 RepID=UPI003C2F2B60
MGKRYYCDFCNKTMVATPSVIKTHNKGVGHQKIVQEYYQQYKDPEVILKEESKKTQCNRFASGNCPFGGVCRFSHYTREEIEELRRIVAARKNIGSDTNQPSFEDLFHKLQDQKSKLSDNENTVLYDRNGVTHVLPWVYNPVFDTFGHLPPSIKRMKIEDFVNAEITEWG